MVEARGIEPLSEDSSLWFSPSASSVLGFPRPNASRRAYGFGSFIMPACGKAYAGPFPTSMTPVTQAVGA